jgi:hypothetical protein
MRVVLARVVGPRRQDPKCYTLVIMITLMKVIANEIAHQTSSSHGLDVIDLVIEPPEFPGLVYGPLPNGQWVCEILEHNEHVKRVRNCKNGLIPDT